MSNLLHRIVKYFKEWDGREPAPTMQVNIDDLRYIASMHTENCSLRERLQREKHNDGWIPCSERLPKENGKYFVTMWDEIIGSYTTEWHFYNGKFMPFIYHTNRKVLAWQPLPPAYKESE